MKLLRRMGQYGVTITMSLVVLATGFTLFKLEEVAHDAQALGEANARQQEVIDRVVADLKAETRERTTESCQNSAEGRDAIRAAFFGLFDQIDQAYTEIGRTPPSPLVASLRERVDHDLPALDCPQDQGPIVVPQPSPTTTTSTP